MKHTQVEMINSLKCIKIEYRKFLKMHEKLLRIISKYLICNKTRHTLRT